MNLWPRGVPTINVLKKIVNNSIFVSLSEATDLNVAFYNGVKSMCVFITRLFTQPVRIKRLIFKCRL